MNINKETKQKFVDAEKISAKYNKEGVSSYHLLLSYLDSDQDFKAAVSSSVLFYDDFSTDLMREIKNFKLKPNESRISNELKAVVAATTFEKGEYELIEHLLLTQSIKKLLKSSYSKPSEVLSKIGQTNQTTLNEEKSSSISSLIGMGKKVKKVDVSKSLINLNEKVLKSGMTQMIGRNEEIQKLIQIIQRKTKNSPIIVGESGVGKSTIVENLAYQIEKGNVPEFLKGKKIVELNTSELLSDTTLQGQLEKKINELLKVIKDSNGEMILYIDNMHTIATKSKQANRTSIAELLKPSLNRGEFTCIGSTTTDDFKKIESDPSLERIFQKIAIEQPSVPETISILRGLKVKFQSHHDVEIDDNALIQAVKLSDRYITDRCFPDKAIDIIDEASSIVKIALDSKPRKIVQLENKILQKNLEKESVPISFIEENNPEIDFIEKEIAELSEELLKTEELLKEDVELLEKQTELRGLLQEETDKEKATIIKEELKTIIDLGFKVLKVKVTPNEVLEVLAQKTGIPLEKMTEDDKEKVLNLESRLSSTVIGQNEAVKAVSSAIRRSQAGLSDPNQPTGSFLFLGSTGVGKTELCKQLSSELFNDEKDLIRFDMSEFMQEHSVAQLIGSPVGYTGSDSGGKLTESVRKKPYSIVLFDEIEKAHPDVLNILLQILDDGRLTDARGNLINFKNTIIVMTSNIGSQYIKDSLNPLGDNEKRIKRNVMAELEKKLKPELINRIDEKVIFERLTQENIEKICRISLSKIEKRLKDKNIEIHFSDSTVSYLSSVSHDPKYGARPLSRKIKTLVEDHLANAILNNELLKGDNISFELNKNGARIIDNNE